MSWFMSRILALMIDFIFIVIILLYRRWRTGEYFPWIGLNRPKRKDGYKLEPRLDVAEDSLYRHAKKMQQERDKSFAEPKEDIRFVPTDDSAVNAVLAVSPGIAICADWDKIEEALKAAVVRLKLVEPYELHISAVSAIGLLKKNGSISLDMMGALYELKNIKNKAEDIKTGLGQADALSYHRIAQKALRILEAL